MGQKLGGCAPLGRGAGSPSNTMWPGSRPTCMPSFILIRPTVWSQCTNVTDRQDRTGQRCDSIRRTVFGRLFAKRFALCYRTVVLQLSVLAVLSVTLVYCGQTVGRIKRKLSMQVRLGLATFCYMGTQIPSPNVHTPPIFGPYLLRPNGCMDQDATWYAGRPLSNFRPIYIVAKRLDALRCHLV